MLNDLGPHLIDQALQLFGMPEAVSADIVRSAPGRAVDDYFDVTLHYGARARVPALLEPGRRSRGRALQCTARGAHS